MMKNIEEIAKDVILDDGTEIVTIRWIGGTYKRVNVTMDSGTAMIRDIMKRID